MSNTFMKCQYTELSKLFSLWFSLKERVSRQAYINNGLGLMLLKYCVDASVLYYTSGGEVLMPSQYLSPLLGSRNKFVQSGNDYVLWALAIWTLPFLWIGISMSLRRAEDAGKSPWLALLFFVPFINYFLMLYLAILPSAETPRTQANDRPISQELSVISKMISGAALGILLTLGMTGISVFLFGSYGGALFLGTPFIVGAVCSYMFNRPTVHSLRSSMGISCWSLLCSALALMLFAFEGIVCLVMAFPLAVVATCMGAVFGRYIACSQFASTSSHACLSILILPIAALFESTQQHPTYSFEVISGQQISAPASEVWKNVVSFSEISSPPELILRSGIAYPLRARIEGEGVGAVRYCEFTTGPFVEPITVWDPPKRLSFNVTSQPPALTEWSPYRNIHPPHLDGYFSSQRGEFRLTTLSNGDTYLEGSTWYELKMYPSLYWRLWTNFLLHRIHQRVLSHIKGLSEG